MILSLDGGSEQDAHVQRKVGIFEEKSNLTTAVDLNNSKIQKHRSITYICPHVRIVFLANDYKYHGLAVNG